VNLKLKTLNSSYQWFHRQSKGNKFVAVRYVLKHVYCPGEILGASIGEVQPENSDPEPSQGSYCFIRAWRWCHQPDPMLELKQWLSNVNGLAWHFRAALSRLIILHRFSLEGRDFQQILTYGLPNT
jgi:hypothetical protein